MSDKPLVREKSWNEFRNSGMLWMANTILQVFGWSIVVDQDEKTGDIICAYPARVKYRGFTHETNTKGYIKIADYMRENADEILKEAME